MTLLGVLIRFLIYRCLGKLPNSCVTEKAHSIMSDGYVHWSRIRSLPSFVFLAKFEARFN